MNYTSVQPLINQHSYLGGPILYSPKRKLKEHMPLMIRN